MIKKNLKTLEDLQNPTKDFPYGDGRWRIWLGEDGDFIDVDSLRERNRILNELGGEYNGRTINIDFIPRMTAQNITVNIQPTQEENKKNLKQLFKEKLGKWNWNVFFSMSLVVYFFGFISGSVLYLYNTINNTKSDLTYTDCVYSFTITGLIISTIFWLSSKIWDILPFITFFTKIILLMFIYIIIAFTLGLISESLEDKVMSIITKSIKTKREDEVMEALETTLNE